MSEFEPGVPRELRPGVVRVVAPNAGPLTGPGTNTWVLGTGRLVVVDPGPADPEHVGRLVGLYGERIAWIAVTHTHRDHSPGAALLAAATGGELIGLPPPPTGPQDETFAPLRVPRDGETLELGGTRLTAVHTPGHASNHVCYCLDGIDGTNGRGEGRWLFTGDHVMGGSTVVIAPPDGDMRAYLDSLVRLKSLGLACIAPGHGPLLERPDAVIDWIVAHRLEREAKVIAALSPAEERDLEALLPVVYRDVDRKLHSLARLSLLAHLEKLEAESRARRSAHGWRLSDPRQPSP